MVTFHQKILRIVSQIPKGETRTYKEIARRAGSSLACRAVGNILHQNMDKNIPCHRIIRLDGKIGGYNRGAKAKERLLRKEGAI